MSSIVPIPLGRRIPDRLHAVSCSLPAMRDVIGYEERDPETHRHLSSGYPRFVVHPLLRRAGEHLAHRLGLTGLDIWLTSSAGSARALCARLGGAARTFAFDGIHGVALPLDPDLSRRTKLFLQNTGTFLSSRQAEDYLVQAGELVAPAPEPIFAGDARAEVVRHVAGFYGHGVVAEDVFLAPSGMNAIHAALQAAANIQRARGRTKWIQLGWLYLDTISLLQNFAAPSADDYLHLTDVFDLEALRALFVREDGRIAGVFAEVPTNPLIQTPDLEAVAKLCREHGVLFVVDPTIGSPINIDVLPYADVVVNSLTKYAASEGDVILGAAIVNPASPHAGALRSALPTLLDPVYPRDLTRLAAQIGDTAGVVAAINRNTPRVLEFLLAHPRVKSVHWSGHPDSAANHARIARSPGSVGSMITFSVDLPLERFYDRTPLAKGPSFGMKTSLICPFMYLAHYDLVTTPEGRATLAASGLDPELLRLSVGCEPADDIIAALRAGLE